MAIIPSEYQEVEYLKGTGTQYIDSGIRGDNDVSFTAVYMFETNITARFSMTVFGARQTYQKTGFQLAAYKNTSPYGHFMYGDVGFNPAPALGFEGWVIQRISFDATTRTITKVDGSTAVYNEQNSFTTPANILLFANSDNGTVAEYFVGRIYELKFYKNGTIYRDFVPCYRKSDDEPGMYETVSGTFFTNSGTGDFVVGPDVTRESLSMLWLRRRMMGALATEKWDYILLPNENGVMTPEQVYITAGQKIVFEWDGAQSNATRRLWRLRNSAKFSETSLNDMTQTQAIDAGKHLEYTVQTSGDLVIGGYRNTTEQSYSTYAFKGDYIKVRIT